MTRDRRRIYGGQDAEKSILASHFGRCFGNTWGCAAAEVWTTNTDAHTYSGRDPYSNCTAATSSNTDAHTYSGPYSNCTATTRTNKYSNCTAATSSNTDYALMLGINGMLKECLGGRQPKV